MRLFILCLVCLFLLPISGTQAAIQLTETMPLTYSISEIKDQKKNRKIRFGKNRAWKKNQRSKRQIWDIVLGGLSLLSAIPFIALVFIVVPGWLKVVYAFVGLFTLLLSLLFLLNGIGKQETTFLPWDQFRQFAIGWLILLLSFFVAFGFFVGAVGFGFGGQEIAANIFGILALLSGLTGLFFLIRGIVLAARG